MKSENNAAALFMASGRRGMTSGRPPGERMSAAGCAGPRGSHEEREQPGGPPHDAWQTRHGLRVAVGGADERLRVCWARRSTGLGARDGQRDGQSGWSPNPNPESGVPVVDRMVCAAGGASPECQLAGLPYDWAVEPRLQRRR